MAEELIDTEEVSAKYAVCNRYGRFLLRRNCIYKNSSA